MTALWCLWLDKVRFRADVPGSPIEYVAGTMALIGSKVDGTGEESVKRLWNSYRKVVELEFGEEMDEEKEVQAIELVGKSLAGMVGEDLVPAKAERLLESLGKGFVPGTFDHSAVYGIVPTGSVCGCRCANSLRENLGWFISCGLLGW